MLAVFFRGLFIFGVVGWYSVSVWKMIDSYFKDQFQLYLMDEFGKNPKMREDILGYDRKEMNSKNSDVILPESDEICEISGAGQETSSKESVPMSDTADVGNDAENVVKEVETKSDNEKTTTLQQESHETNNHWQLTNSADEDKDIDENEIDDVDDGFYEEVEFQDHGEEEDYDKRFSDDTEIEQSMKSDKNNRESKLNRKNVIFERDKKFADDGDFREFEEEEIKKSFSNDNEDEHFVKVEDLPYRPYFNLYGMDKLSTDEYCPLSLDDEDEESCDEIETWTL